MKQGQRYPDQKKIVVPASPLNLSVKYGDGLFQPLADITLAPTYTMTPGDQLLIILDLNLTGLCQVKLVNVYKACLMLVLYLSPLGCEMPVIK